VVPLTPARIGSSQSLGCCSALDGLVLAAALLLVVANSCLGRCGCQAAWPGSGGSLALLLLSQAHVQGRRRRIAILLARVQH
jgi:uncharacterized protein (TIGR03382 family)